MRTSALGENDVVKPTVTVHGTVTGGKDAMDAAVTLVPGGMITVGRTGHVKSRGIGRGDCERAGAACQSADGLRAEDE